MQIYDFEIFCKKSVPKWHIFGLYIRKKENISYFESCCLYCRTKSGLPDRPQVAIRPLNFSDGFLRAFYCNDAASAIQTAWLSDCPKLIRFRAVFVLGFFVQYLYLWFVSLPACGGTFAERKAANHAKKIYNKTQHNKNQVTPNWKISNNIIW